MSCNSTTGFVFRVYLPYSSPKFTNYGRVYFCRSYLSRYDGFFVKPLCFFLLIEGEILFKQLYKTIYKLFLRHFTSNLPMRYR